MASRFRWFVSNVEPPLLAHWGDKMLISEYRPGAQNGFRMFRVRKDLLEGRYIERVETVETLEDPLGNTHRFDRVEYRQISFRIGTENPSIEVQDPGKTHRPFFDKLSEYSNFEVSIEPATVDLVSWLTRIEEALGKVEVRSMRLSDVPVSSVTAARIELVGSRDVRRDLASILSGRNAVIDRIEFVHEYEGDMIHCELAPDGRAAIYEGIQSKVSPLLRTSLQQAVNWPSLKRTRAAPLDRI